MTEFPHEIKQKYHSGGVKDSEDALEYSVSRHTFQTFFCLSGRQGTSAGLKPFCSKGNKLCKFHRSSSCCSNRASCSVLPNEVLQVFCQWWMAQTWFLLGPEGALPPSLQGSLFPSGSGWELGQITLQVAVNSFPWNPTYSKIQAGLYLGADEVRTHQHGVSLLISAASRNLLLKESSNWQPTTLSGKFQNQSN